MSVPRLSEILCDAMRYLQLQLGKDRQFKRADSGRVVSVTCFHDGMDSAMKDLAAQIGTADCVVQLPIHLNQGRIRSEDTKFELWCSMVEFPKLTFKAEVAESNVSCQKTPE